MEAGIPYAAGEELQHLDMYDGYHFSDNARSELLKIAAEWVGTALRTAPLQQEKRDDADVLRLAVAPDLRGQKPKCWWDMRSQISGGQYKAWCSACGQALRGTHADGDFHAGRVLRVCGINPPAAPPAQLMQSGMRLPAGIPKTLNATVIIEIHEMKRRYYADRSGGFVVVTRLPEAGMRCVVLVGHVHTKEFLAIDEVAVGMNGLEINDDDEYGLYSLRTIWVERCSLRCVDVEYKQELPFMATSGEVMDRGDSYFGIMRLDLRDGPRYMWHCSSPVRKTVARLGFHRQLVGCSEFDKSSGRHSMVYPSRMALEEDQGAHNMCLVDFETGTKLQEILHIETSDAEEIVGYAVGGQYEKSRRNCKFGVCIYSLHRKVDGESMSFVNRKCIVDGYHEDCLELRPKFGGVGEFDGQSVLVYFGYSWFLYTRANCGARGHRQVQVCVGKDLDSFAPFAYVSFAGVPIDADIYFAHVYRTDRGTMAAIFQWPNRRRKMSRLGEVSTWRSLQTDLTSGLLCCCKPHPYTIDAPSTFQSTTSRWF